MTAQYPKADLNEIKKFLYAIFEDGDTIEVRCLDCKENRQQDIREGSIRGGFFNNRDLAAAAIASMSGRCMGVYIIPNQITDELLARFPENTLTAWKEGDGTGDGDVTARRWLLIDCDFERTAKISSTDAQHQQALDKAAIIKTYLIDTLGFPPDSIISADSGNGAHLMVRVDVPLNKEGDELILDSLKVLESLFGDGVDDRGKKKGVHIDLKVFNRARIWKTYGSLAAKGNNTTERPHRIAGVLSGPQKVVAASFELLRKLAELKPEESKPQRPQSTAEHRTYGEKLDLTKWLTDHGINYKQKADWEGWHMYQPDHCIFDQTHVNSQTMFMQNDQGAIKYDCKHNSCAGKTWHDVWQTIDPHTYDFLKKRQPQYTPPSSSSGDGHGDPADIGFIPTEYAIDHITTDMGNAERFIRQHGDTVRYNAKRKMWLIWQGTHWAWDDGVLILKKAQETVKSVYAEAAAQNDFKARQVLATWAKSSESNMRISAMLSQAKAHVTVEIADLDRDGLLYNCLNGTIDLRTGQLREPRQEDLITVCVPIRYDPDAQCPKWDWFMDFITVGDTELKRYLKRAVGYTITGETKEQVFFDCYGKEGLNGKTTFLNIVGSLAGDYGRSVPIDLFLHNNRSNAAQGHTESLANVQGKRFIMPSELEIRARLAMGLLKTLTGQDKDVAASHKGEKEINFKPICKIWIFGNHKPIVTDTGNSFWRRLKLIPFNNAIDEDKKDKNLPDDLQRELSGVLNWAISGCLEWQQENGFGECKLIISATQKYREESDELKAFIDDAAEIDRENEDYFTTKKALKEAYGQWCEENGRYPLRSSEFIEQLRAKGIIEGKRNNQRGWLGIKITYSVHGKEDKADKGESKNEEEHNDEPDF
jgi:P4 family phage/plasmid primase-like protien